MAALSEKPTTSRERISIQREKSRTSETTPEEIRARLAKQGPPPLVACEKKLQSYVFYNSIGRPKHVAAPMVDQSELPFRLLCRRYGADIAYTPMFHSHLFSTSEKYRAEQFSTCAEDRPLIVQFCANQPETLLDAARFVEKDCDAIDLNLGCPQHIARRGFYGAFLQESPQLIFDMVRHLHTNLSIPITCKMRILKTEEDTIAYAKMLEAAGCQMLTVHGRTREQKGHNAGVANWDIIAKIRESISIPLLANGSVESYEDIEPCIKTSKADGVMAATGLLVNPALFYSTHGKHQPSSIELTEEYMELALKHNTHRSIIRAHLFKLLERAGLPNYIDLRQELAEANDIPGFYKVITELRKRTSDHEEIPVKGSKKSVENQNSSEDIYGGDWLESV